MDIIDIVLARALTPQGQISTYAAQAQKAVRDANAALDAIESITSETDGVRGVIDELQFSITGTNTDELIARTAKVDFPSGKKTVFDSFIKYYRGLGDNEDGAMTQKAITDAIRAVETSAAAAITISDEINGIDILGRNEDGNIALTGIKTESLVKLLAINGLYDDGEINAYYINYDSDIIEHRGISNEFPAYIGGRRRCNVSNDGTITAFAGIDSTYTEDGSNGNVMVYVPKFYYLRIPITIGANNALIEEYVYLSDKQKPGFQLFPAFYDNNTDEIDYILYSAFEGGLYDASAGQGSEDGTATIDFNADKLVSYSNLKPISNITIDQAKQLAQNNNSSTITGEWGISNIYTESANQIIMALYCGSFNMQLFHIGISQVLNSTNKNCAVQTGNTQWNQAEGQNSSVAIIDGKRIETGKMSVNFYGIENPYGNIWKFIDKIVYYNKNLWLNFQKINNQVFIGTRLAYTLPSSSGWAQYFGYDADNNFLFIPVSSSGTSNNIIGDYYWAPSANDSTNTYILVLGGPWNHDYNNGLFYYGFDNLSTATSTKFGARIIFTPIKNASNYNSNINKWKNVPVYEYSEFNLSSVQ